MGNGRRQRRRRFLQKSRQDPPLSEFNVGGETTETVVKLDSNPEFVNILQWMWNSAKVQNIPFEKGCISPVNFIGESYSYRGIAASRRIPKDATILYIPEQLLITLESFVHVLDTTFDHDRLETLSIHDKFVVFLLLELAAGESSNFLPYLKTLPEASDFLSHPIHLDQNDSLFKGLPFEIRKALQDQRELVELGFARVKALLSNSKGKMYRIEINYSYFQWVWLVVNTRTVFYQRGGVKEMALAPFLDLINHSPQQNTVVEFVKDKKGDEGSRGYLIKATQTIEQGSQIFISYGSHPNYKLWVDYGFIPFEPNPEDFIPIDFNALVKDFLPLSPLRKDARKASLVEKYALDQELNLLCGDVSPNLILLVGISLWDPEVEGRAFGFQTDLGKDRRLKTGVLGVIEFKLQDEDGSCLDF